MVATFMEWLATVNPIDIVMFCIVGGAIFGFINARRL